MPTHVLTFECVAYVEGALKELPGVENVVVNLGTNKVSLTYDPVRVTLSDIARAVDGVGYQVPVAELTLDVRGMTCASCVALIGLSIAVPLIIWRLRRRAASAHVRPSVERSNAT